MIKCRHCHGAGSSAGIACARCLATGYVPDDAPPCHCPGCLEEGPPSVCDDDLWGNA